MANGQEYNVTTTEWSVKDGLSDREVKSIVQDGRGFLWLGTRKGLNFFDGRNFKVYTKEKDGLPFNYISNMVQDAGGDIWVMGSELRKKNLDNNLFIFDPLTKKVISFRDKTGYQGKFGFDFLQQLSDSFLFFGHSSQPYFFTWNQREGLHKINYPRSIDPQAALLVKQTANNSFWMIDTADILYEVDRKGRLLQTCKTANQYAYALSLLSFGLRELYVLMPGQKKALEQVINIKVFGDSAHITHDYATDITTSSRLKFAGNKLPAAMYAILNTQRVNSIWQVIFNNDGSVWIATSFGLVRTTYTKSRFHRFFQRNDTGAMPLNSFRNLVVSNGVLYGMGVHFGIWSASALFKNYNREKLFQPAIGGDGFVTLTRTAEGRIFSLHTSRYTLVGDLWRSDKITIDPAVNMWGGLWHIYQVSHDSFIVGSMTGLLYFDNKTSRLSRYSRYNNYTELDSASVMDIIDDRTGHKWLCTDKGLYTFDIAHGVTARYSSRDTGLHHIPSDNIQHLYQDADGIYWLAGEDGLIRWNRASGKCRLFTTDDELSHNNIHAVYEDTMGRLWLSSDYGLMQFNKKTFRVRSYFTRDGISHNEFNRASHTSDSAGNIYFGSMNGVTAFNPADFPLDDTENARALAVASFEQFDGISGQLVDKLADIVHTSSITLQPGDRFFDLSFALLSFDDAFHNTYYWKIEGIDSNWITLKEPSLRISGLPYGNLTLRIKARSSDGTWGRNELHFSIHVLKPVYLRTWFIALLISLTCLAIVWVYRWRASALRKENEKLDAQVKEKTLVLEQTIQALELSAQQKDVLMKEIHHRVKNNLQVISTLLHLQLSNILDNKARQSLEESASRINSIALVHFQLYQGKELTLIELSGFIRDLLQQVAAVYLEPEQDINLQCNVPETLLDIDTALPLGLILNELMTNSFKYAYKDVCDCKIGIDLQHAEGSFQLTYRDYGPGLPESYDVQTGNNLGMTIIRSLSKQLGGSFSYNREDNSFLLSFLDTAARKRIA